MTRIQYTIVCSLLKPGYVFLSLTGGALNPTHSLANSLLDPKDEYVVFHKDRADKVGGGVCAFISKKMRCLELDLCNLS